LDHQDRLTMKIHLHPEGLLFVRDTDGNTIYQGTPEEAALELNVTLPPMPEGMVAFHYDEEARILVYYDAKQNAYPVEGAVPPPAEIEPVLASAPAELALVHRVRLDHALALLDTESGPPLTGQTEPVTSTAPVKTV
jgi:hypothetical protein